MKKEDLKKLSETEINKELKQLKKEIFDLRLSLDGGEVKDYSQFGKIRKNIARCLTFLRQKQS
ncbi:MAG: 50S ribosomal protein L29 [candidate division TM6 bacterium GW2011_GWF2_28_16]|jgi:large subunit ribosomal protein L29|nr:MAG: 50S ribosomal protein L29 [candidate division TM6 bacterium GW2011_GWF2_28_16]